MLRSEVSQELYTALMDVPSPSRSRGGNLLWSQLAMLMLRLLLYE